MSEDSGSQRYCRNCGTEIRSDIRFCVSCGRSASGKMNKLKSTLIIGLLAALLSTGCGTSEKVEASGSGVGKGTEGRNTSATTETNVGSQSSSLEGTTSRNEDYPTTPEGEEYVYNEVMRALGPDGRSSYLYYWAAGIPGLDYDPYYDYRTSIWESYGYTCEYINRSHTHPGFDAEGKSEESHPKTGLQYHWFYECVHYSYYQ